MKNINEINDLIDARINILSKDIYRITLLKIKIMVKLTLVILGLKIT